MSVTKGALICFGALFFFYSQAQLKRYTPVVNTFIGTGADGNTYPGASMPFGGVQLSPDTRKDACSGYGFDDKRILGFSHTHLSGVGEPEYLDILMMPFTGKKRLIPGGGHPVVSGYSSSFDHQQESASPGFYSVHLKDYNILAELTTTLRAGFHRYTFPRTDSAHIIIDLAHPGGATFLQIRKVSDSEIEGLRRSHGWAWDQYVYFVARFSKPFSSFNLAVDDSIRDGLNEASGKNVKALISYKTALKEAVMVKVGISAVSVNGARKNLDAEIPGWNFEGVKQAAAAAWEKELSKIEVEGGTPQQQTLFYTAMYHAFLSPNIFMDVDGNYRGVDHQVHRAKGFTNYTVFSLWDTYRALHPLFAILDQKRTTDFIKTLLQHYDDGGRLPMWPLAGNYTDDMLGYHAVPVIVDAYMKGIRNYDVNKAFRAVKHSAELDKLGLKYYKKVGYLPYDHQGESVSKTLEYCYDDWCISQMAKGMKKWEDYKTFHQRAHYWENVFDTTVGFMRGKSLDGHWMAPFDPLVNSAYSEGNAYQYLYVPHDVEGLLRKMGGEKQLSKWLDVLFALSDGKSDRGSIGQYWHGNEPSHHLGYLYNYTGEAWKTQKLVRQILMELYTANNDGLAGNDDCGQISAWYILSALGFYPVTPGLPIYAIGSPLFPKATIHLPNGKKFVIKSNHVSEQNVFIASAKLCNQVYNKSFLKHDDIMNGGELIVEMAPSPNKNWAASKANRPVTGNGASAVQPTRIVSGDSVFEKSTLVGLACQTPQATIRYTLDGSDPGENSPAYIHPFSINKSTLLKMRAYAKGMSAGAVFSQYFEKEKYLEPQKPVSIKPGLKYDYFEKFFVTTADLELVQPVHSGVADAFKIEDRRRETYFGFRFQGYIRVPMDGIYRFFVKSNDGSRLYVDGKELIENDGNHAAVEEPGSIALKAGLHQIMLKYFQCGGGKDLQVSWSGPSMEKHQIRPTELFIED